MPRGSTVCDAAGIALLARIRTRQSGQCCQAYIDLSPSPPTNGDGRCNRRGVGVGDQAHQRRVESQSVQVAGMIEPDRRGPHRRSVPRRVDARFVPRHALPQPQACFDARAALAAAVIQPVGEATADVGRVEPPQVYDRFGNAHGHLGVVGDRARWTRGPTMPRLVAPKRAAIVPPRRLRRVPLSRPAKGIPNGDAKQAASTTILQGVTPDSRWQPARWSLEQARRETTGFNQPVDGRIRRYGLPPVSSCDR